jgi:hypothetical protein
MPKPPVDPTIIGDSAGSPSNGNTSGSNDGYHEGGIRDVIIPPTPGIINPKTPGTVELPGDLGTIGKTWDTLAMIQKAYRSSASANFYTPWNHRYRGNREAFKFNLFLQRIGQMIAFVTLTLRTKNTTLATKEAALYSTDTELAAVQHIREQIRFKEYMLLRDNDKRWFI